MRKLWSFCAVAAVFAGVSTRAAADEPPDTPLGKAWAACDVSGIGALHDSAIAEEIHDGGHSLLLSNNTWAPVGCVLEQLGLPEWPLAGFPGWVAVGDYLLVWTSTDEHRQLLVIDGEVAPDAIR